MNKSNDRMCYNNLNIIREYFDFSATRCRKGESNK